MYSEEAFLQLSALQHFIFCPRQCALIHIEQVWQENLFTAEGRIMHEKAHAEKSENKGNVRIERGIALRSFELGLIGKADVVEFHREKNAWHPFPVEYKRGKPKLDSCDEVQLCAQAMCLEEMLNVTVECGAIFYGKTRRRFGVEFTEEKRRITKETSNHLHEFIKNGKTPKPEYGKKCESCSLTGVCQPKRIDSSCSVTDYLSKTLKELSL